MTSLVNIVVVFS